MAETFDPYEIIAGNLDSGLLFICDHARNTIPNEYGSLGLPETEFSRHIAYDIGAEALTRALASRFNAPAVLSCFSRLLIDPNRGEDDPTIIMRLSDGTVVPGNHPISEEEIRSRIDRFHKPYHEAIESVITDCMANGCNPIVFSIHSFTPFWKLKPRTWEAAILWDSDPRLPNFMLSELRAKFGSDSELSPEQIIGDNQPYDGALKNDTMYQHCTTRGLAQALLEVRQDLIETESGVEDWADRLEPVLAKANLMEDMHRIQKYPSRADQKG